MDNSDEIIGTTVYLTSYTRCCINRYRHNWLRLYILSLGTIILSVKKSKV